MHFSDEEIMCIVTLLGRMGHSPSFTHESHLKQRGMEHIFIHSQSSITIKKWVCVFPMQRDATEVEPLREFWL